MYLVVIYRQGCTFTLTFQWSNCVSLLIQLRHGQHQKVSGMGAISSTRKLGNIHSYTTASSYVVGWSKFEIRLSYLPYHETRIHTQQAANSMQALAHP